MVLDTLIQAVFYGILTGGVYALVAVGLTLIFGVMDVVNFAHGAYVMLAMYMTFFLWQIFGLDPFLSILIVAPAFFLFGVVSERLVIHPIIDEPSFAQIFATVGLTWVFENAALYFFGPTPRGINAGYGRITILNIPAGEARVYGFLISIAATLGLFALLYRTKTGRAIRATAQSKEAAELMGMNTTHVFLITFGLGIALAGIAGSVVATLFSTFPHVGATYVLIAFVVVVLGGLGNVFGALVGGLVIGVIDSLVGVYIDPVLGPPIYYVVFIAVLLFRATDRFEGDSLIHAARRAVTSRSEGGQ